MKAPSAVVLDSGPLSVVTQRRGKSTEVDDCVAWLQSLEAAGVPILVPEIADYEVRRELLRAGKAAGLVRLDVVKSRARYVPITTRAMLVAAESWARARQEGLPTAAPDALDADVILSAQALTLGLPGLVVATSNPAHLGRFLVAEEWRNVVP